MAFLDIFHGNLNTFSIVVKEKTINWFQQWNPFEFDMINFRTRVFQIEGYVKNKINEYGVDNKYVSNQLGWRLYFTLFFVCCSLVVINQILIVHLWPYFVGKRKSFADLAPFTIDWKIFFSISKSNLQLSPQEKQGRRKWKIHLHNNLRKNDPHTCKKRHFSSNKSIFK